MHLLYAAYLTSTFAIYCSSQRDGGYEVQYVGVVSSRRVSLHLFWYISCSLYLLFFWHITFSFIIKCG
jgi:hypothetical protein